MNSSETPSPVDSEEYHEARADAAQAIGAVLKTLGPAKTSASRLAHMQALLDLCAGIMLSTGHFKLPTDDDKLCNLINQLTSAAKKAMLAQYQALTIMSN